MVVTLANARLVEQVEESTRVIGYNEPGLRGTNLTLAHSAGMLYSLAGPDTLTYTGNYVRMGT